MFAQLYRDHTLFGHSLLATSNQLWVYHRADLTSTDSLSSVVEFAARRVLAPMAASLTIPICFTAKMLHFGIRTSLSPSGKDPTQIAGECLGLGSMFTLPQEFIDQRFSDVEKAVSKRWEELAESLEFSPFSIGRDERSIANEFNKMHDLRAKLWFVDPDSFPCQSTPDFRVSQPLLLSDRYRQVNCLSFEHSATDFSYNSTCITVGKRRFFALEGPLEEHVPHFFRLLANWNVAHVVCLTGESEKGTPKCYPYWKDHVVQRKDQEFLRITIQGEHGKESTWGAKEVPYLSWHDWEDHHGVDPGKLIQAVDQVRKQTPKWKITAAHCSAGVGRTGTFIAALSLIEMIDDQLAKGISPNAVRISVAQLFLYLNLHRPWLVAKPSQYLTLYRTVETYLNQKMREPFKLKDAVK